MLLSDVECLLQDNWLPVLEIIDVERSPRTSSDSLVADFADKKSSLISMSDLISISSSRVAASEELNSSSEKFEVGILDEEK